jgi:hypothetical protein
VYESAEVMPNDPMRGKPRKAPLLMGKGPSLITPRYDPAASGWHNTFLPVVLVGIGAMTMAVLGLAWWYRRGDADMRQTIALRREQNPF